MRYHISRCHNWIGRYLGTRGAAHFTLEQHSYSCLLLGKPTMNCHYMGDEGRCVQLLILTISEIMWKLSWLFLGCNLLPVPQTDLNLLSKSQERWGCWRQMALSLPNSVPLWWFPRPTQISFNVSLATSGQCLGFSFLVYAVSSLSPSSSHLLM